MPNRLPLHHRQDGEHFNIKILSLNKNERESSGIFVQISWIFPFSLKNNLLSFQHTNHPYKPKWTWIFETNRSHFVSFIFVTLLVRTKWIIFKDSTPKWTFMGRGEREYSWINVQISSISPFSLENFLFHLNIKILSVNKNEQESSWIFVQISWNFSF